MEYARGINDTLEIEDIIFDIAGIVQDRQLGELGAACDGEERERERERANLRPHSYISLVGLLKEELSAVGLKVWTMCFRCS